MKKIIKEYKWDILIIIFLIVFGCFQVLRNYGPGLYYDAVNPDNLALQVLNGKLKCNHFPFLGQIYHGTITIWLQIFIILLVGKANILTLRFANIFYVIITLISFYLICKKMKFNKYIVGLFLIALVLSPHVFLFIRTQYYIKLPGAMFITLSLLFSIENNKRKSHKIWIFLSSLCAGLAFYSYFIYLFYFPVLVGIFIYYEIKNKHILIRDIIVYLMGYIGGILLYILGYLNIFISAFSYPTETITNIFNCVALSVITIYILLLGFIFLKYDSKIMPKIIIPSGIVIFIITMIILIIKRSFIVNVMKPLLTIVNVSGVTLGFKDRVIRLYDFFVNSIKNIPLENQVLGKCISILSNIPLLLLLIGTIIIIIIICKKGINENYKDKLLLLLFFVLFLFSFLIFSIFFISRMGNQHFTYISFIIMFTITIEFELINDIFKKKYITFIIYLIPLILISINIYNTRLISKEITKCGGYDYYSSEINSFSLNALNSKTLYKEVYIFKDWGLYTGFNYLTNDKITIESYDIDKVKDYISNKQIVHILIWKEDSKLLINDLEENNIKYEFTQYYDKKENKIFSEYKCVSIIERNIKSKKTK